jgi:hypothetical protein
VRGDGLEGDGELLLVGRFRGQYSRELMVAMLQFIEEILN